ncbi:MAG: hypothetical protein FJX63_04695 [Alphaproteobacteria bacterium]|nr:hypothetical protein [Alphaproteobacteria bacterium]
MARIVVIGGANVDIKGRVDGPFIAATSNPGRVSEAAGGVARNIAHNLGLLGADVALIARIGDDERGYYLRRATGSAGVDVDGLIVGGDPTGAYLALLDGEGELLAAVNDMAATEGLTPHDLEARQPILAKASFIVADCNLSPACLNWLVASARRSGTRLLIEPVSVAKSMRLLEITDRVAIHAITPNRQQLEALTSQERACRRSRCACRIGLCPRRRPLRPGGGSGGRAGSISAEHFRPCHDGNCRCDGSGRCGRCRSRLRPRRGPWPWRGGAPRSGRRRPEVALQFVGRRRHVAC